ncbi:MAG TPA: hypothetical protein DIV86_05260 [Alphaproteobacteria bacterium]|nr:hypothetical protein [Alphaproteobacteria bacterium]
MTDLKFKKLPEVWALLEEAAGHNAQVLGVVEALQLPYIKKKIIFNKSASLPNFLKINPFNTINKKRSDSLNSGYPDIIISCGRKLAPIALQIKKLAKKQGKKVFAVHILWPGLAFRKFDMLAIPSHDNIIWPLNKNKKIFKIIGAPNRINKEFLLQEYKIWSRTIGEMPSPRIAVLIGGNSKKTKFTQSHAKDLIENLVNLTSSLKASLMVTNSRRTDDEVSNYIEENLRIKIGRHFYFHNVKKNKANPYFAYLQLADIIISTGDSISMLSEAATSGKPLYIYSPEGNAPKKHHKFQNDIINLGFAKEFNRSEVSYIIKNGLNKVTGQKNLNTAETIAKEILKRV